MIFPGAIIGGYAANAVTFDGTNDYLLSSGDPTGVSNSKVGLLSFWFKASTPSGVQYIITNGGIRYRVMYISTGQLIIICMYNASNAAIGMQTTVSVTSGSWRHILASWDASDASKCKLYCDGIDLTDLYARANQTITYALGNDWSFGSDWGGTNQINADMAEFWFDTAQWLDLTSSANREKFAKNGRPMTLGSDGSKPTGIAPKIYFKGPASNWGSNAGTGGNFSVTGALTDASTKPSY